MGLQAVSVPAGSGGGSAEEAARDGRGAGGGVQPWWFEGTNAGSGYHVSTPTS